MLKAVYAFKGFTANLIALAVLSVVLFGTEWPPWISIPAGLVLAVFAAMVWGYFAERKRVARERL